MAPRTFYVLRRFEVQYDEDTLEGIAFGLIVETLEKFLHGDDLHTSTFVRVADVGGVSSVSALQSTIVPLPAELQPTFRVPSAWLSEIPFSFVLNSQRSHRFLPTCAIRRGPVLGEFTWKLTGPLVGENGEIKTFSDVTFLVPENYSRKVFKPIFVGSRWRLVSLDGEVDLTSVSD